MRRCSRGLIRSGCLACSYLTETPASIVKSVLINGREVKIEGNITCKTKSFLYFLRSRKAPQKVYGGQSGATVANRLGQHRRDIINRDMSKIVARHFSDTYSTVDDLEFVPVKIVRHSSNWARLELERKFINDHNLLDDGLNLYL